MEVTSAHLGLGRDEFLAHLLAAKLLSDDDLARATADPNADAMRIADGLLTAGLLTAYQLDAITAGRLADLRVGNYDLLSRLGAGGMGTVFKARHRRMKRIVAIKVLASHLCSDPSFVQRFQREVEVVARLGHPNVVMAYDADEAEIGHFLVMEFVNGRDLFGEVEKRGTLPVSRAVDFTIQAARGLAYAHAQGIVHRDVKPHNLLLDDTGTVKVTDLGLARLNTGPADAGSLTQAGGILGTVDYMPPEQAVDSTVIDARADIYSLGCTLFFLLTGTPPFTGPSLMSVLLKHRDANVPSARRVRSDVSEELEQACHKMMAKSPADRYQTMQEVIGVLAGFAKKAANDRNLPIATGPSLPPPTAAKPTDAPATVSVLIVEPSRVQSTIIRQYLEAQGMTVVGLSATGHDAIATCHVARPTGLVTALHLADMTGVDLAKQVRAELPNDAPGVVVISSEADAAEVGTLSKLVKVVTLAKPFTPDQLVQSLNLVTGKSVLVRSSATVTGLTALKSGSTIKMTPKRDRTALRVLVVDDSSTARLHERKTLTELGFVTFTDAADGADGIAAAARQSFDLIVTDYNMPLIDGRALVSYLKNNPVTAAIPIFVVTTEDAPAILDPLRALGVSAIFDKAFPLPGVKAAVDLLFGA